MPASARTGVAHRHVLDAAVAVMHESGEGVVAPGVDRLLEDIEDEIGRERRGHAPPHDAAREDIDHKRRIDEALPGGDVRETRHPELDRTIGDEPAATRSEGRGSSAA